MNIFLALRGTKDSYSPKATSVLRVLTMKFAEWTYPLRKFDDIYYTIERIVYSKGELKGFTTEDIYNNLRDKRFFNDVADLQRFLLENGRKYKIRKINGIWERYW
jgi:hypothetical protein